MTDFNQPTRKQDEQVPSATPLSGQQAQQTQQGAIERNPADGNGASKAQLDDENDPDASPSEDESIG